MRRAFAFLLLTACGAKTSLPVPEVEDASVDTTPPEDRGIDIADATDAPDEPVCIPFQTTAELASLDLFLLVDSSGSMGQLTADGSTKAEAVTRALEGFLSSPESTGVGAALTFFPSIDESVQEFCASDGDCGPEGSCFAPDFCDQSGEFCEGGGTCPPGEGECVPLGRCSAPGEIQFCLPDSIDPRNDICIRQDAGLCVDLGLCENRTSCELGDYGDAAIAELPEAGAAIVEALATRESDGGTPTLPAVSGVLDAARRRAVERPGNKIVMIVATDGFPADCDDAIPGPFERNPDRTLGIGAPAEVLAEGAADGIETFVLGVFEPEDEGEARENLSTLAASGGTSEALVVTTDEDVTERLLEELNELRAEVRSCVYAIPAAGAVPDPRDLEVRLIGPDGVRELVRVENEAGCAGARDGFFFQQDIAMGARPGFAELCDRPCTDAQAPEVRVEMQAGCR